MYVNVSFVQMLRRAWAWRFSQTDSFDIFNMVQVRLKSAFEHAQNTLIQIILSMRKVSSCPFALCSYILYYAMILLADSEGSDQTVLMRRLRWCAG